MKYFSIIAILSRFTVDEIKQAVSRAAQRGRNGKVLIVPNAH
jgi:hypothetical protein